MSWQLRVYTPTGGPHVPGSQIASYDANAPGGIVEGFHWSCSPHGDCLQMEFTAVPRLVDIPPRAIVQLLINGNPAFYGFVTRSWPATAGRAERYVALGASQLLRQRYADVIIVVDQDIAQVVHTVVRLFNHPAIHYSGPPPDTGYTLTSFKAPWVDIATILKDLSSAAGGVPYGVRADGSFFFQRSASATSVNYDSANIRHLPVEGSEVVDIVRLLHPETGYVYTHNTGLGYGSERTVIVPQMHNYLDRFPGTFHTDGIVTDLYGQPTTLDLSWLYDDTPTTGHVISFNPPRESNCSPEKGIWGLDFRLDHNPLAISVLIWRAQATLGTVRSPNYPPAQNLGIRLTYPTRDGPYWYDFGPTSRYTFLQPVGFGYWKRGVTLTLGGRATGSCMSFSLSVFQFATYTPGPMLAQFASSLAQPPYRTPSEVRIPGYTPPTTHLTILNTPSGDVTGPVARWEYIYTVRDGIVSVANIGQPGTTGEAEAIKILATQISAEGDTRLRW